MVLLSVFPLLVICASCLAQQRFRQEFPQQFSPQTTQRPPALIIKQINQHNEDGSYTFGFESEDGSYRVETKELNGLTRGKYGYLDATGTLREVEYSAGGKFGYEPVGDGIRVPPRPTPDQFEEEQDYDDQGNPIGPKTRTSLSSQRFSGRDFNQPLPEVRPRPAPRPDVVFEAPVARQNSPEVSFRSVQHLPIAPRQSQQLSLPVLRETQQLPVSGFREPQQVSFAPQQVSFAPQRQTQPQVEVRLIDDLPPVAPSTPIRQNQLPSLPQVRQNPLPPLPQVRQNPLPPLPQTRQRSPLDDFFSQLQKDQTRF